MYKVTKDLQDFCLAHRLGKGYPGKCKNLHGHNYSVQVTLDSSCLDQYDMVIDFGDIKKYLNTWVQDNWDHATMVTKDDKALLNFLEVEDQRRFVVDEDQNSTAEFMSKFLFEKFQEIIEKEVGGEVGILEVKVWETADSFATWTRPSM